VASDVPGEAPDPTLGADSGPKRSSTGRRFGGSCGQAPASPVGAAWIGAAIGLGAALMKNRRRRR